MLGADHISTVDLTAGLVGKLLQKKENEKAEICTITKCSYILPDLTWSHMHLNIYDRQTIDGLEPALPLH
jgi:hypothetical protein